MTSDFEPEQLSADDARLLADLGQALGRDDPPEGLVGRAEGLVAFMDVDRELVELLDAAAAEPVGSRGLGVSDRLAFELADGSVSLELSLDGHVLAGQILSGGVVEVTVLRLDGEVATSTVDDLGQFSLRPVPAGPVRLRLRDGSGRTLVTDWFLV